MTCSQAVGGKGYRHTKGVCEDTAVAIYEDIFGDRFAYCIGHLPILQRLVRYGMEVRQIT